jgi:ribose 5-phosphate isomerase RpiB
MVIIGLLSVVVLVLAAAVIGMGFKMQRMEETQQVIIDWLIAEFGTGRKAQYTLKIGDRIIIPGAINER